MPPPSFRPDVNGIDPASSAKLCYKRIKNSWINRVVTLVAKLNSAIFWAGLFVGTAALSHAAPDAVRLPVEVVGEDGVAASVTLAVPAARAAEVKSLWMQVHGLEYADMVSVQISSSGWVSLNNESVAVAEPARSYGGIGGGFATVKLTLSLAPQTILAGANTIQFRFNHTDGAVSGFRVLAFNFLTADGRMICPTNAFVQENPDDWVAPLPDAASVATGQTLWNSAPLRANGLAGAGKIAAHCSDCHARDGRDLKYFNFSNGSIVARSRFHGLTSREGEQIASYIRSLPFPNPGRPWNPPYQPGPGLDSHPAGDWAAGAGLAWVLDHDAETLRYVFTQNPQKAKGGIPPASASDSGECRVASLITPAAFRPDGNLNPREIPISLQLPDWNHWLPRVHPLDAWGSEFLESDFAKSYQGKDGPSGLDTKSLRGALASPDLDKRIDRGEITRLFESWSLQRAKLLRKPLATQAAHASPELTAKLYSTQLWQLVKAWELTQEFGLEGRSQALCGDKGVGRTWFNTIPAETAPAATAIPDGPNGMGGSALVNEFFDNAWYELQLLLNNGNHQHQDKRPIDWVYFMGRFLDLQKESHRPEPGRVLVAVIKAMQSTDPGIGPENQAQGWRADRGVEPAIMVSPTWAPVFEPLPKDVKTEVTQSLLEAWLDKNTQYPFPRYFTVGLSGRSYKTPVALGTITGGKTPDAAQQFLEAGVRPQLVRRLVNWGRDYADTAARFSY